MRVLQASDLCSRQQERQTSASLASMKIWGSEEFSLIFKSYMIAGGALSILLEIDVSDLK